MQSFVRASTLNEKLPKRWRRSSLLHQDLQSNSRTHRELYCTGNLAWNTRKEINRTWAKYRISWFLDFHYSPQAISVDRTWNKEKSTRKSLVASLRPTASPFWTCRPIIGVVVALSKFLMGRRHIFFHQFDFALFGYLTRSAISNFVLSNLKCILIISLTYFYKHSISIIFHPHKF